MARDLQSRKNPRHVIQFEGRRFENDYVFPAEIAALRAHRTGQFQEAVILQWIRAQKLKGAYMDVGAHIGNHTLFFAAFCASTSVTAIEGHPTICDLLDGNVRRNLSAKEVDKVAIYWAAAWEKSNKKVQFAKIPRNNAGHSHIINTGGRKDEVGEVEVNTIAIDDIPIDKLVVLKIDVEDSEEQVLDGAKLTIAKHRPLIVIERHNQKQLQAAMQRLQPIGYRIANVWKGVHTYALKAVGHA